MGKLNIPDTRKLIGYNLAPKPSHVATGRAFEAMIAEWDWSGWIKPQIDSCSGNGLGHNCLRLIGGVLGVVDSYFTQAVYNSRWRQLADYCVPKGIHLYPGICGKSAYAAVPVSVDQLADLAAAALMPLQQDYGPWVIGVDLLNEADKSGAPNNAFLASYLPKVTERGIWLPKTFSSQEQNLASAATAPFIYQFGAIQDFLDVHMYTYPVAMQALDPLLASFSNSDVLIGEFGRTMAITEANRVADEKTILELAMSGSRRIRGCLKWAATDQDTVTSNQYGLYDAAFNPRVAQCNSIRRYTGWSVSTLNGRKF